MPRTPRSGLPGRPLRLAQVGAGSMGRAWLQTIRANPDVELVGLADLYPDAATSALADVGMTAPVAGSVPELLTRIEADALINVTIPEAHATTTIEALDRGLDVLCEKPIADTTAAALTMVAAAQRSGRLLMISQSRRYYQALDGLRAQIAQIGEIGMVNVAFYKAPHFGGFRDEMDHPLLVDMAIHQFDLARDLIGSDPVSLRCESFNPPWSWYRGDAGASVYAEFESGVRFTFNGCWCSPGLETSWNGEWRISASDGSATWDGDHAPVAENAAGDPVDADMGEGPEQIAGSLAEFVTRVRTGTRPDTEAARNVLSLAMVEAATRSADAGGTRVTIADVLAEARQASGEISAAGSGGAS